jgi:hypothetical protein
MEHHYLRCIKAKLMTDIAQGERLEAFVSPGTNVNCFHVRSSNRPIKVKRFQTIRRHGVDVAHGLAPLFGLGTKALPS